jgi:hypothetical protein
MLFIRIRIRSATQCNATQRNATQRNATQRNATQRDKVKRMVEFEFVYGVGCEEVR